LEDDIVGALLTTTGLELESKKVGAAALLNGPFVACCVGVRHHSIVDDGFARASVLVFVAYSAW
jgi:hypothetical protein